MRVALAALRRVRKGDLQGAAALATQGTLGAARIAEGVHSAVHRGMGLSARAPAGRTGGLTGPVYRGVSGITRLVGASVQLSLGRLQPFLEGKAAKAQTDNHEREALVAALNGVMGDRLVADGNPLATPLSLRARSGELLDSLATGFAATGKILLLVHGLCVNNRHWHRGSYDHGESLAQALGYTPVYLRYNSGRHTSYSGHAFARALEQLVAIWRSGDLAIWPVPVERLDLLGHSTGGLVLRSALQFGMQAGHGWRAKVRCALFLGTPHHGAPLERAGHGVDLLIGSKPWSRPFARLAQLRSCGITDLRYGHVQPADWQGRERFRRSSDTCVLLPLPTDVRCYGVAATLASARSPRAQRLLGDGLVPLNSALGVHKSAARTLQFEAQQTFVVHGVGHLDLLCEPRVARQLRQWLQADQAADSPERPATSLPT